MRNYLILFIMLVCSHPVSRGQTMPEVDLTKVPQATQAKSVNYWFDGDVEGMKSTSTLSGKQTLDASILTEGLHTLHFQVIDTKGAAAVGSTLFYKTNANTVATAKFVNYWFNGNPTTGKTVDATSGLSAIDASALKEGIHTLHCQIIAADNVAYSVGSAIFMKLDDHSASIKAGKLTYWFDSETTKKSIDVKSGVQALDVSELITGLHTLHCQVIDGEGKVCPPASTLFLKLNDSAVEQAKTVSYWFDEDYESAKQADVANLVKIVDAAHLPEGPHALHYQLKGEDGKVFPICSAAFERWLFDIYVKELTEYNAETISSDPVFGQNPWLKLHYSADDTAIRGRLSVDEGTTLSLGKYVQTGNLGAYNYYDGNYKFISTGDDYYHPTTLINQGFMRADSVKVSENLYHDQWHFISLPFNVDVSSIEMPTNTYWALRRYDGEARAASNLADTWQNLRKGDKMEAGKGYIMQLTRETDEQTTCLTFKAENDTHKNDIFKSDDAEVTLNEYQSEFAHNRSWNLTGNPYPSFFDTRYIEPGGIITVWDGNSYKAYSLTDDDYVLMPFEAFFIQKPLDGSALIFNAEGRQHTHEVRNIAPARIRQAMAIDSRRIVNFTVTDGNQEDLTRLVINEQASANFESDKDAPKFFVGQNDMEEQDCDSSPTIQLFSVEAGVKYAINERPMNDGYATLSLIVPRAGDYSLNVGGNRELTSKLAILDTESGRTWTAAEGELTFRATAGRHNARFIVSFGGQTTGIGQQSLTADGEMGVIDGQLTFRMAGMHNVKVYAADGRLIHDSQMSTGSIKLESGIYLINVDGKTTKIIVK